MSKIKILIADDHAIVRSGLQQLLKAQSDIEIIGEASNGREVLKKIRTLKPDIVILDIVMPKISGLEVIVHIRKTIPSTQIVVLSMYGKESFVHQVLSSGALGYVLKASPLYDIIKAIHAVHRGEYFLSSQIKAEVVGNYLTNRKNSPNIRGYDLLSDREQQIFRLVADGSSTNQIAEVLCVSPKTIEKHRTNIMKKLELKDRLEIVKYAIKIGIIDPFLWEK